MNTKTISDSTPLIPEIIADIISAGALNIFPIDCDKLSSHLCEKAETIFRNNKKFRRQLKGQMGREYLYIFMDHWMKAYLLDNGCSRDKLPR